MRWILILLSASVCAGNFTFNETTASFNDNITTFVFLADFTVNNASYESVCANYSYYVDLICDCLKTSNPEFTYTCVAETIDDVPCIAGNCTCIRKQSRRLMAFTMSSGIRITIKNSAVGQSANLEKARHIDNTPPGTSDYSTRDVKPPDNVGVIVGSTIGGVFGIITIVCCVRHYCRKHGKYTRVSNPP